MSNKVIRRIEYNYSPQKNFRVQHFYRNYCRALSPDYRNKNMNHFLTLVSANQNGSNSKNDARVMQTKNRRKNGNRYMSNTGYL